MWTHFPVVKCPYLFLIHVLSLRSYQHTNWCLVPHCPILNQNRQTYKPTNICWNQNGSRTKLMPPVPFFIWFGPGTNWQGSLDEANLLLSPFQPSTMWYFVEICQASSRNGTVYPQTILRASAPQTGHKGRLRTPYLTNQGASQDLKHSIKYSVRLNML